MANKNSHGGSDVVLGSSTKPAKLIIDTDPGIDDSMAILMAFQTPELEILGLTTVFGNVTTEDATRNALILCEIAGCPGVTVAEGSPEPLKGGKPRVADFVHGSDGMGNTSLPPPKAKKCDKNASEYLVDKVSEYPGEVSILALGPLTNLALAIKRDSSFASKVKNIVILGGAFFALGNVNPAAEANIYGDPEAADVVFTSGANIAVVGINITTQVKMTAIFLHDPVIFAALVRPDLFTFKKGVVRVETQGIYGDPEAANVVFTSGANIAVVGINITTQVKMTNADLLELRQSEGKYAQLLSDMCKFYRDWHVKSDGVHGIFLHDPVSFVALVRPELFTFKKGVVRVETQGVCIEHTLMDQGLKTWNGSNPRFSCLDSQCEPSP